MARSNAATSKRISLPIAYAREESKPRNFILVLIEFAIVAVCSFLITAALDQLAYRLIDINIHPITADLDRINLNNALEIVLILLVCLYVTHFEKRSLRSMGFIARFWFPKYLWGLILGFLSFAAAAGIAYQALGGTFTINYEYFQYWPVFAVTAVCFVIQGLAEEVLCRGYLLTSLERKYPLGFAAILSGLVFSALHGMNPGTSVMAYVNIFLVGVFLSLMFYHTGSIWMPAAWHSMWNLVQGNVFGLKVSGLDLKPSLGTLALGTGSGPLNLSAYLSDAQQSALWSGGEFGLEASIGCTLVLLVLIILECILIHHKFRSADLGSSAADMSAPTMQDSATRSATTPQNN